MKYTIEKKKVTEDQVKSDIVLSAIDFAQDQVVKLEKLCQKRKKRRRYR